MNRWTDSELLRLLEICGLDVPADRRESARLNALAAQELGRSRDCVRGKLSKLRKEYWESEQPDD